MSHPSQLLATESGLLVIDVQDKLLPLIPRREVLIREIGFLIDAARLVDVPVQATEQYPHGLGGTAADLARRLPERLDKTAFSSCAVPSVVETFRQARRSRIVLAGIETHVCVLHTALDLLAQEFRVYLAVNALASRYAVDHETALRRLEKAGGVLTTVETVLFEWVGGSAHPKFKQISALVQERMKGLE